MSWREHASPRRTRPPLVRGALTRPRLSRAMGDGARVLLLAAPAGYGKTTALAAHLADFGEVCWYTLDADDTDPQALAGGVALTVGRLPGGEQLEKLMDAAAPPHLVLRRAAQLLEARDAMLVLDEAQHLAPNALHDLARGPRLALLSRTRLEPSALAAAEARGEVLRLGAAELAFDVAELEALLRAHGLQLERGATRLAHSVTEGWPIAARFLAQALAAGRVQFEALRDLESQPTQLSGLFAFLAQEVLGPLEPSLRDFLTRSSVFEALTPQLLADVLGEQHAGTYLEALAVGGTFLVREGSAFRAHPLLRAHLRGLLPDAQARELAARGAAHFERAGLARPALHAHLQAGNATRAGELLLEHGGRWLAQGRLGMLERCLDRLGEGTLQARPELFALLGDVRRLQSRYLEALEAYGRAPGPWRALGQARVHLDTVQPALAEEALREAEASVLPQQAEELRRLLAENALNSGQLPRAVAFWPGVQDGARYALRSGNLQRTLRLAREGARGERGEARAARNHREALLLESLVCAMLGELDEAEASARAGLAEGERLESPFVVSLAYARLGHVQLARGQWDQARATYEAALQAAQGTVPRLTVEPLMGLAFLAAASGAGREAAARALAISEPSGDRYMSGLVRLTSALGLLHAGSADAPGELRQAEADFARAGDAFGVASAQLALYALGSANAAQALRAVREYPFLLQRPGLFAPSRSRAGRARLLCALARDLGGAPPELTDVARALGYPEVPAQHPGFEVEVRLLGRLALRVGGAEVRDWGRAKARDLLALLALRPDGLAREVAQELLYPDVEPAVGERNFRIVLHALGSLLEPGEAGGYFLERGEWLRLRPTPDLRVDVRDAWVWLEAAAGSAGRAEALLSLPGEFARLELPEVELEAERYAARVPEALAEEAGAALGAGRPELAVRLCERALVVEPAHEPAARLLMRAHHIRGHLSGVARTYAQCRSALAALDLTPLPETDALYRALRG